MKKGVRKVGKELEDVAREDAAWRSPTGNIPVDGEKTFAVPSTAADSAAVTVNMSPQRSVKSKI